MHLTATRMAEIALVLGTAAGVEVEVFDKDALVELGCGGLLGVNGGSVEPPRMIKLTYRPGAPGRTPHLALVGKGIMYDSGGISLKPSDAVARHHEERHVRRGAVLAAMSPSWAKPVPDRGHRLPDVHRQHAVRHRR